MKITGVILCLIGVFFSIGALASSSPEGRFGLSGGIIWMIIGGYLIWRSDKKKREKEERDKWMNGES